MKKRRSRNRNVNKLILENLNILRGKLYLLFFFNFRIWIPYKYLST